MRFAALDKNPEKLNFDFFSGVIPTHRKAMTIKQAGISVRMLMAEESDIDLRWTNYRVQYLQIHFLPGEIEQKYLALDHQSKQFQKWSKLFGISAFLALAELFPGLILVANVHNLPVEIILLVAFFVTAYVALVSNKRQKPYKMLPEQPFFLDVYRIIKLLTPLPSSRIIDWKNQTENKLRDLLTSVSFWRTDTTDAFFVNHVAKELWQGIKLKAIDIPKLGTESDVQALKDWLWSFGCFLLEPDDKNLGYVMWALKKLPTLRTPSPRTQRQTQSKDRSVRN